jgi:pyruvate, water dikinase
VDATPASSGLPGLDAALNGILPGDNVVWQVDDIDDYLAFVLPFCEAANRDGRRLVYFRFSRHSELLPRTVRAEVHRLHPESGFDAFISEIFDVIERTGPGACYVFDCLSDLAVDWYSDRMLGNFFLLTCPYLFRLDTVAYFALLKNYHSADAIDAIHHTAQVVIDVYRSRGRLFLQPRKVEGRHSRTMFSLHAREDDEFQPVTSSAVITRIMEREPHFWVNFTAQRLDVWTRAFIQAEESVQKVRAGTLPRQELAGTFDRLLRMVFTRDESMLCLAKRSLDITDVLAIGKRMIGTGLIGGKSAGMLVARGVLRKRDPGWSERLEDHDSFYVGSDVFYTYLVVNGCWWLRREMRSPAGISRGSDEVREKILSGGFPDTVRAQFREMLDYFGQSPIIVRSSSLLEDAYGNAFSGKYESVFCANQGTPDERLAALLDAVREVYASAVSREALKYREHRGLLDRDEQMALLIQRVSGGMHGDLFYPQAAGVGFSFNPYVWHPDIDPKAGVLRLVFGLGTRAVNRNDDDHTRVVALNDPQKRPESGIDEVRRVSQRKVDVLDLAANRLVSVEFAEAARPAMRDGLPLAVFATPDPELERYAREHPGQDVLPWFITFDRLLGETTFVPDMRLLLSTLQEGYGRPVDIEFTVNIGAPDDSPRINLLQCRPLQVKESRRETAGLRELPRQRILLSTRGPVVGNGLMAELHRIVFVVPAAYAALPERERYEVARVVGKATGAEGEGRRIMLVGPGRWGTSTPSLGVPATFADLRAVGVLVELAKMHEGLVPEVSLGTHFFNDIIENDMLYVAVFPDREGFLFDEEGVCALPNRLPDLVPEAARWAPVVMVAEFPTPAGERAYIDVDTVNQRGEVFLSRS